MSVFLPLAILAAFSGSSTPRQATFCVGRETVSAVVESNSRFAPAKVHRTAPNPFLPPSRKRPGIEDIEGPNSLPVGGVLGGRQGNRDVGITSFPGVGFTGFNPPDPHLAAGPTHVIQVLNSSIGIFDRTGANTFEQTFAAFFSSFNPGPIIYDPKVVYDWHSGHFVVAVLEQDPDLETSKLLLAVSAGSDPTGTWYKYRLEAKSTLGGEACWADFPGLGYNKDGFVVSVNMFGFTSGEFKGVQIIALSKAGPIVGGAASATKFVSSAADSFGLQPAETLNPTANVVYLANAATTNKIKIWTVSGLSGVPPTPTSQLVTVPSYVFPTQEGAASTSGHLLDDLDGRLINCMYVGTGLVAAHTVLGTSDTRRRVRWYEFSASPTGGVATLNQSGEVKQSGTSEVHYHLGAIGKAPTGDIALIMTRSGPDGPVADIVRTIRKSSDPLGTMGAPSLIEASSGPTYGVSDLNPWGNYAAASPDPLNQRLFWGTHMTGDAGTGWRTVITTFAQSTTVTPCIADLEYPATIAGGAPAITATIKTSASAPANLTVYLSSSNTALASVPATAIIPAGTTSGTFPTVFGAGVDASTNVTISAKLNNVAFSKVLTLTPAVLQDFTLAFPTLCAGNNELGTLTLNGKAGPAGRVVSVSSDNPVAFATAPSFVVPSGSRTKSFTIFTQNTTVTKVANFTATLGGSIVKALTVIVPPSLRSFTITPGTIQGGLTAVAKPVLVGSAPAGGVLVKFTETSPDLSIAPSALIAMGNVSINLSVPTQVVGASTPATVEARLNGQVITATITITP